ncbi:Crp/Fnr family transcriptional regulator [Nocardiopsis sp. LOL_012]|uniref:Crp/Fnr family transcriptional regulator n=1 Tax=Nocardiopsis sp. LOL_012 TaxID=3345409 RepID=UPI003A86713A
MDASREHTWPPHSALAGLDEKDVEYLLTLGRPVDHPQQSTLMRLGERTSHVLVILEGHVKVTTVSRTGKTVLLALRSRGDLVGELAVMDESPRMATVETAGPVSSRVLSAREFRTFLERSPEAALTISASIAAKLRSATERILDYSTHDARTRLARVLMRLIRDHGVTSDEGIELDIRVSQPELASITSLSEAALYKGLADLRHRGIVTTGYRRFTVTDVPALAETAGFPPRTPHS